MKPKVLFIYTQNPGITFYRFYQFAKKWYGWDLAQSRIFPDFDPKRLLSPDWEHKMNENWDMILDSVDWADFVIVQSVNSPEGLSLVEAIRDLKPCYMEIDDYFKQVPGYSIAFEYNKPGENQDYWATRQMIESTGVICSTEYLAKEYKQYNPNIKIIPNCIDFDLWQGNGKKTNGKIRVGWIGGATHKGDLKLLKDVLPQIVKDNEKCEVYIVSYPPPDDWEKHDRIHMIHRWSTIDRYHSHLQSFNFDIGLAPLRDNLFNRGKSNLRYLEYSACKTPTIASDVEPFRNNFEGYLCRDDDQWYSIISNLVNNENVRTTRGIFSYQSVKEKFNVDKIAKDYLDFINENISKEERYV